MEKIFKKNEIAGENELKTWESIYDVAEIAEYIEEREVHILRVLRSEREWKKILGNQCNYSYPEK